MRVEQSSGDSVSFSHFQKIHITRVFKILTIILPPLSSHPLPSKNSFGSPQGVSSISTAPPVSRVLKFKFVKKYCLVDYIQQITVTQGYNC